jgi:hypothetical protein
LFRYELMLMVLMRAAVTGFPGDLRLYRKPCIACVLQLESDNIILLQDTCRAKQHQVQAAGFQQGLASGGDRD